MKTFLLRGVPQSVMMDGWWMSEPPEPRRARRPAEATPLLPRAAALLALIVAGDALLWQAALGLSLVIFGMLVLLALCILCGGRGAGGLAVAALFSLPLLEEAQALSIGLFVLGMTIGAVWIALGGWPGLSRLWLASLRFVQHAPCAGIGALFTAAKFAFEAAPGSDGRSTLQSWALPLGLGLVFASLLVSANPMLKGWLDGLLRFQAPSDAAIERLLFWGGLALVIMPFLVAPDLRERLKLGFAERRQRSRSRLINAASVQRSLILFNLMFAVQTLLDLVFLWGGAGLPEGMSYAAYAHRGAYPLLATALLAGAFALVARPFSAGDALVKAALLVWIGQNILLVASSLLRLDAYVDAYGLTHLRLAAAIWMVTVALGLGLTLAQTLRDRPASWLLARVALLGLAVLYASSFLSFSATVARHNLASAAPLDRYYTCTLGAHALPAILAFEQQTGSRLCYGTRPNPTRIDNWREWGFRDWRAQRSLEKLVANEAL